MSQLSELKRILLGDHAEEVEILKQRVEGETNRTKDISEVLPEAIEDCLSSRGEAFSSAMSNTVSSSVRTTIKKDPEGFAAIFFPALAPSIRMMIANAIRSFSSSMNQTIESATTLKGLKWRLESIKTGVPYSEIALRKNLQYRVEQVFLIDKDSGLLIHSLINDNVQGLDSDAVSAMLTAIQSFVRESFNAEDGDDLTDMAVGGQTVWMIHEAGVVLACVIRGEAPLELRKQLNQIVDQINKKYHEELNDYDGSQALKGISTHLEPCLQLKLKEYSGELKKTSWVMVFIIGALAIGLIYWLAHSYEKKRLKNFVSSELSQTPGVLPTNVFWQKDKLNVLGLIDPLAEINWDNFEQEGLAIADIELLMKQYNSAEPEIFERRLRRELAIPSEVNIAVNETFDKKFVILKGGLNFKKVVDLKSRFAKISRADLRFDLSGVTVGQEGLREYVEENIGLPENLLLSLNDKRIQLKGVSQYDWFDKLMILLEKDFPKYQLFAHDMVDKLHTEIKMSQVVFDHKAELADNQQDKIENLVYLIKMLDKVSIQQDSQLRVGIKGYSDGDNTELKNILIRNKRALFIKEKLIKLGVKKQLLKVVENTNLYGDDKRMVRFFPIIKLESQIQ